MKTTNRNARTLVNRLENFKASNIFAETKEIFFSCPLKNAVQKINNKTTAYVVYSYGYHFPMYANIAGKWYGNKDKYSRTTSKQQNQTRPNGEINFVSTEELNSLLGK